MKHNSRCLTKTTTIINANADFSADLSEKHDAFYLQTQIETRNSTTSTDL